MNENACDSTNNNLRNTTATVIFGILLVASYWMMRQVVMSQCLLSDYALRLSFSALLLGPFALLYQWFFYSRIAPAVTLWVAYCISWLTLRYISQHSSNSIPILLYMIFIFLSIIVFFYSSLLAWELRNSMLQRTTLLATMINWLCSGIVLLDIILCPIVI